MRAVALFGTTRCSAKMITQGWTSSSSSSSLTSSSSYYHHTVNITIELSFYLRLYGTRCSKCCHLITQSDWIRRAGDQVGCGDNDEDDNDDADFDDDDGVFDDEYFDDDDDVKRRTESISETKLFRFSILPASPATLAHAK